MALLNSHNSTYVNLFICGLFKDTLNILDCMSNDGMINEQWIWKDMKGNGWSCFS
jgi:hypothetical protein